jgi:hypothetical protein
VSGWPELNSAAPILDLEQAFSPAATKLHPCNPTFDARRPEERRRGRPEVRSTGIVAARDGG